MIGRLMSSPKPPPIETTETSARFAAVVTPVNKSTGLVELHSIRMMSAPARFHAPIPHRGLLFPSAAPVGSVTGLGPV